MTAKQPIGVFDSGVGGLTVVRALRAALPGEDIVYLGDTARVPYGSKSPRTVEAYSFACARFLLSHDIKLLMVACNTASATALPGLSRMTSIPVIGAVEPGAAAAVEASAGASIGVIGTLATVRSGAYERAIARLSSVRVTALACPLLVPLAEEGWTDDEIAAAVSRRYLTELFERDADIDTLVLGCTHYPLLRDTLETIAEQVAGRSVGVVDSATAMAHVALATLGEAAATRGDGTLRCYATDASRLDELASRFLGEQPSEFELVDLQPAPAS